MASIVGFGSRVGVELGNSGATLWANLVSLHIGALVDFLRWLVCLQV
jgi:hypothetical protein